MRHILFVFFWSLTTILYSQNDGGMLCGGEDEIPIWILRFSVFDRETHQPVKYANIEVFKNRGDGMKWQADHNGVAVLVITTPNCLPYEGTIEITSNNHRYYTLGIDRAYFISEENGRRIFLEGHRHNWTDMNQIPNNQELINKISDKRYQTGIKYVSSGAGFDMPNYAPACFEFEIELDRIENGFQHERRYPDNSGRNNSDTHRENQIPIIRHFGEKIYVFPNDLSGSSYHLEKANTACNSLQRLGYDDWYLPSKEELNILYQNKDEIGRFSDGWYWSSTPAYSDRYYWGQSFNYGDQERIPAGTMYNIHKGNMKVRCIRKD